MARPAGFGHAAVALAEQAGRGRRRIALQRACVHAELDCGHAEQAECHEEAQVRQLLETGAARVGSDVLILRRDAEGARVSADEASRHGVTCGQVVYGGDLVSPEGWDFRDWVQRGDVRTALFWLAVEACSRLG